MCVGGIRYVYVTGIAAHGRGRLLQISRTISGGPYCTSVSCARVCVCVCVCERESVLLFFCVCVCVCVCVRESVLLFF